MLRDVRMWEARRRLGGGQAVTQVAYAVGYGSVAAFSRAFSASNSLRRSDRRRSLKPGTVAAISLKRL